MTASSATAIALTTTGRIGVNTATPTVDFEVNGLAKLGNVTIGAIPLYAFLQHVFTNATATGRSGPSLSAVRTAYSGVSWAQNNSYLSMTGDNGIQLWTVPVTGNYLIQARGAAGGGAGATSFGRGRDVQLITTLVKGEVIRILVGQQGEDSNPYFTSPAWETGAGGGGTYVVRGTQTPIIVAGGGGGTGYSRQNIINNNANIGTSGNNATLGGSGGTNGQGGVGSADGGGGGMFGNGSGNGSEGGLSFINGGFGGIGDTGSSINGGFGGGGGGNSYDGGGGGGGYSGGGGGGGGGQGGGGRGGGGGGSFGITTLTDYGATNTGHGSVIITLNSPSSDFDVSGVSRLSASSATATALTTTGRIGVNMAAPTVDLDVVGNASISGSMTINGCTPRSSVTYASNLRTNYSIPVALRGGSFITNKVYFSIRVPAGNRFLFLKPNGSASTFHSFIQQAAGTSLINPSGVDETAGFRMCEIIGGTAGSGYTPPSFTHIVGEFTIIRDTVGHTSTISSVTGITTRIYGTLVQYGNHYMQKWDFQGQAVQGAADDSYDRIDLFQFLTSDATKDADGGNSVAVTIEG
jgi:hypothetical protein